jgi:hypothetical protein
MPNFILKDYCNEINEGYKKWEVVHPRICGRMRKRQIWKPFHMAATLESLYYTTLLITTPYGLSKIVIGCMNPDLFDELTDVFRDGGWGESGGEGMSENGENGLFNQEKGFKWWTRWGKSPILVSCPIILSKDRQSLETYTLRSQLMNYLVKNIYPEHPMNTMATIKEYELSSRWIDLILSGGSYTVCSGQTWMLGLHRAGYVSGDQMCCLLSRYKENYNQLYQEFPSWWKPSLKWYMNFDNASLQMLINIKTNVLIGDHLPLYACYGGTDKKVMDFLMSDSGLNPLMCHVNGSTIMYVSLYAKTMHASSPSWAKEWQTLKPYLSDMSVNHILKDLYGTDEDEEAEPESDSVFLVPLIADWYTPFAKRFVELSAHPEDLDTMKEAMEFFQKEYEILPIQMAFKLYLSSFGMRRLPKKKLEAYWEFIYTNFVKTSERWTNLIGYMLYYYHYYWLETFPWAFLKWAFEPSRCHRLQLFLKIHFCIPRIVEPQTLREVFLMYDTRQESSVYLFYRKTLQPILQNRVRVIHQLKRDLPKEVADVFTDYLTRHKELIWQ